MIKVANNLQRLAFVKLAETEEEKVRKQVEKARTKDRQRAEKGEVPNEARRVDYAGRARRGALLGALVGAVPGAALGYDPKGSTAQQILKVLGGAAGGAILGGGVGALSNTLGGFLNADVIERRPEPNRLRRGLTGALAGIPSGAIAGALLGGRENVLAGSILGGLGGAGLGYLQDAYMNPYLNKDLYSQNYLQDENKS